MQIHADENIGDFVNRLEREAKERLALAAQIRNLLVHSGNGNGMQIVSDGQRRIVARRDIGRPTLADNIATVMRESGRPMTQPEIRDALYERGIAKHLKNPLSAISTAISRKEGIMFERGDQFEWRLLAQAEPPLIRDAELAVSR